MKAMVWKLLSVKAVLVVVTIILTLHSLKGKCDDVSPPPGSVIEKFEGPETLSINCMDTTTGHQTTTIWSFRTSYHLIRITTRDSEFETSGTYSNTIKIVNFTLRLDGYELTCGHAENLEIEAWNIRVYVRPPVPRNLQITSMTFSEASLSWQEPEQTGQPLGIRKYEILITDNTTKEDFTVDTEHTSITVMGLQRNTVYLFRVRAVSVSRSERAIGKSDFTEPVEGTTTTVPAPNCESVQLRDGKLVVSWDFTHTGDLPLTRVLVTYTYRNGEESITNTATDIQNLTTASVEVNNIVAGITYTFSINATNSRGSKVVNCDSVTIEAATLWVFLTASLGDVDFACPQWALQSTVDKIESIRETIAEDIADRCSCEIALSQAGIQCLMEDQHSVAFRATLETTSSMQSITDHILSWVENGVPIIIHSRSLTFDRKYPVGIIHPKSLVKGYGSGFGGSESLINRMTHLFTTS